MLADMFAEELVDLSGKKSNEIVGGGVQ